MKIVDSYTTNRYKKGDAVLAKNDKPTGVMYSKGVILGCLPTTKARIVFVEWCDSTPEYAFESELEFIHERRLKHIQ